MFCDICKLFVVFKLIISSPVCLLINWLLHLNQFFFYFVCALSIQFSKRDEKTPITYLCSLEFTNCMSSTLILLIFNVHFVIRTLFH